LTDRLGGKVAIITGASRGQGAAEARLFAQAGALVVLGDVLDAEGEHTAEAIRADGGSAMYRRLDVADSADWQAAVAAATEAYGRLDVLVNNAGIAKRVGIDETSRDDFERIIQVNLVGPFLGIKAVAARMRDSGGGSIVNTGSAAALVGHFTGAYAASKWGLRGLAQAAAREYAAWGIRVNSVHPGIVETPIVAGDDDFVGAMIDATPMGRPGAVSEIASVVLFLASDDSSFVTGQDIAIDGGFVSGGAYHHVVRDWERRLNIDSPQIT
jgi:3alpha(or 20beta)-hydroxysteroid dehydrogenase